MTKFKLGETCYQEGREFGYEGPIKVKIGEEWFVYESYYSALDKKLYAMSPREFQKNFSRKKQGKGKKL